MRTNAQENTTEGSFEIPERRGNGIAGPSREVSQRDQMASCTVTCAGRKMSELEWLPRPVKDVPAQRPAEQKTGLLWQSIGESRESKSTNRKRVLVMREIPLYLIPAALQRGVKEKGGMVYRIGIVRSHLNHYTIKIRCNTKKAAEHKDPLRNTDQLPNTDQLQTTVQLRNIVQNTVQSRNTDHTNTTGSSKCGDEP